MALLRMKEIKAMSETDRQNKLKDLKLELIKSGVGANKATAKTKEIKRAISRLISFNKTSPKGKGELKKQ
jgi:ribosomal protein L29